jgi:MFS transporter, PHS family, inorganic phosphate transporter
VTINLFWNVLTMSIPDKIDLIVIVIATFAISLAGSDLGVYIIGVHVIWRFIVGSECPLSAVIASEFAPTSVFNRLMPRVFTPEGWGNLGTRIPYLNRNQ